MNEVVNATFERPDQDVVAEIAFDLGLGLPPEEKT